MFTYKRVRASTKPLMAIYSPWSVMKWLLVTAMFAISFAATNTAAQTTWYVKAGAKDGGGGSKAKPFNSLADVEAASGPGDIIMVLHAPADREALDGGITLRDDQKLIGTGPPVTQVAPQAARARITNSSGRAVTLANNNEVANLDIANADDHAIFGQDVDGTRIHDNLITGWNAGDHPGYGLAEVGASFPKGREAIRIVNFTGDTHHEIVGNAISDGLSTGIGIEAYGGARIDVLVKGNSIRNINVGQIRGSNHPAIIVRAEGSGSKLNWTLEDTNIDNVSSFSAGVDAFVARGGEVHSVLRNYIYTGSSAEFPRYGVETITVDPDISLHTLLMENCTITGAGGPGVVIFPIGIPPTRDIIDLGGGPLGSVGHNRIYGNSRLDFFGITIAEVWPIRQSIVAKHNWWGTGDAAEVEAKMLEVITGIGARPPSSLEWEPFLTEDPLGVLSKPALSEVDPDLLLENSPNPFNPSTTIRYTLPEVSKVKLTIYNALGQKIRVLVDVPQTTGSYKVQWDGRDDSGRPVASGLYLYRLDAGLNVVVRKMMLIK